MNPDLAPAILALEPKAKFQIVEDDINQIDWQSKDVSKPSNEAIELKLKELQTEYDAQEYARTRRPLYPDIGDQLDDLYKKGAFSDEMAAKIKKVKDDNPKPS